MQRQFNMNVPACFLFLESERVRYRGRAHRKKPRAIVRFWIFFATRSRTRCRRRFSLNMLNAASMARFFMRMNIFLHTLSLCALPL